METCKSRLGKYLVQHSPAATIPNRINSYISGFNIRKLCEQFILPVNNTQQKQTVTSIATILRGNTQLCPPWFLYCNNYLEMNLKTVCRYLSTTVHV